MTDTLVALDANSLIHRAFHALPLDLTSPKGELTNATYGFTMMLLRAMADLRPTHVAAAFDTPKPTFRHERFEAYKGTRPATPDGLVGQFQRVAEVLGAFHVPIFQLDGLEADDILGTLAARAVQRGLDVVIVTGDLDALQLVGPKVRVMTTRKGVTDTVFYDEQAVRERYGLEPAQLADFRALRGDATDNIPGVPGIGEKTATQLLAAHGDIEAILSHLDQLPPRQRDQLAPYADQVRMARHLAEIVRDAPIEIDLDQCATRPPDRDKVLALFHELDFRALIERLPKEGPAPSRTAAQRQPGLFEEPAVEAPRPGATGGREHSVVCTVPELDDVVGRLRARGETICFILLLDRAEAMRAEIVGLGIGGVEGGLFYIPLAGPADGYRPVDSAPALAALRPLLEDSGISKAVPNAKQAVVALGRRGIELRGVEFEPALAAYLVESSQRAATLQDLSWSRLNRELPSLKALTGEGRASLPLGAVPINQVAEHVCREVATLLEIRPILKGELADSRLADLYRDVELPLIGVLARMEQTGVAVDVPYLQELSRELYERITHVERGIYDSVGHEFNIGSPQQLATILFEELKLPQAKRTATGRASTAAEVLNTLKGTHLIIDLILEHRELTKLKSTYVDALPLLVHPETGRVHTTFNQTVAVTGRLSSSDPNLQNIPIRTELGRRVRRAFIAPDPGWKLVSADYSQIELRIQAHLTQDPKLIEAFLSGEDVHRATAAALHGVAIDEVTSEMRGIAKTANFAMMYGVSPFGLAEQTGLSHHDAAEFIRRYFDRFQGVEVFQKRLVKEARENGYVTTLLGRKRFIPELRSSVYAVRAAGERMAVNAPVQGTASDIIKAAMVRLASYLAEQGMRSRMLLQVHDELLFEAPDEEVEPLKAAAKEIMEGAIELSVPVVVDFRIAQNWGAMY